MHAPEALAALHQEQAAQGAWGGGHLPGWQVPHPAGGLRVPQPHWVRLPFPPPPFTSLHAHPHLPGLL